MTQSRLIRRSLPATCSYAAIACGAAAMVFYVLVEADGPTAYLPALLLAVIAVLFALAATHGAWRARCPECDRRVAFSSRHGVFTRCRSCGASVESRGGHAILAHPDPIRALPDAAYLEQ